MVHIAYSEHQIREKSFLLMVPLFAAAGFLWACIYYYFGARSSALIPGGYSVVAIASLLLYRLHRDYHLFRTTQLVLILLLPFLLHLSLGNFISSSAVILWSTLCPLGALAFHNAKAATYWFIFFLIMVAMAFLLENKLFPEQTKLPGWLINLFFALNISAVTFLTFFVLKYFVTQNEIVREKLKQEQTLLSAEREKSERLLLNILPPAIARRLKDGENVIADEHGEAAVLFADIVGFTNVTQNISALTLIENLNKIFTYYDSLVEKYGLEKIKTIGDSYMVVSGLRGENDHMKKMSDLALEMIAGTGKFSLDGRTACNVRIGIHTGPVIAGIIGSKKFSYDVWGDAVNTASRMEAFGEPGKIQISDEFYQRIKDDYECEYRGQIEIKSKGAMNLYILKGKKFKS
jgi:guanylate cyclase